MSGDHRTSSIALGRQLVHFTPATIVCAVALGVVLAFGGVALWKHSTVSMLTRLKMGLRSIGRHGGRADEEGRRPVALAQAFHDVSKHLGLSIATHAALSHIDKTILGSLDMDEIARSAIRCLRLVTAADLVIILLNEIAGPRTVLVYMSLPEDPDHIARSSSAADYEAFARLPKHPEVRWQGALPLPAAVAAKLKAHPCLAACSLFPIQGSRHTRGAVILGRREAADLGAEQLDLVGDLAGRLRIACATAERNRRLKELAHADALTGLPNRHALLELLPRTLAEAAEKSSHVAVLFLDLDRFKQVNDTLGHGAGDLLLRHAAERIRRGVREGDTVARQGGDEFTVVLAGLASSRDAGAVARELIAALTRRFEIDGKVAFVGASVGIAVFPEDGSDPSDLLRKADTAMYRAKSEGRNRLAYFQSYMAVEVQRRAEMDGDLRRALQHREFVLNFQPLIDLRSGKVCAVEALLRWHNPEQGLLLPDQFVPFAEESGLIDAIGTWVLKEACAQHQRWRREGVPIKRIAVNVSIGQMRRSHFVRTVQNAIATAGLPPDGLEIEVTESILLQGDKAANEAMRTLAAAGVLFAIDDFGTGYSSFSNLTSVPARVLKLDRSFIAGAARGNERGAIVTAMIQMAHALHKEVVAEGVETEDELALLQSLGCDMAQGFLLCKPLSASEIAEFARERNGSGSRSDAPAVTPDGASDAASQEGVKPAPQLPAVVAEESDEWLTLPLSLPLGSE